MRAVVVLLLASVPAMLGVATLASCEGASKPVTPEPPKLDTVSSAAQDIERGPRFRIGLIHGVVAARADADSGKQQNVVVRTELKVWSPFLVPKVVDGRNVWLAQAKQQKPTRQFKKSTS